MEGGFTSYPNHQAQAQALDMEVMLTQVHANQGVSHEQMASQVAVMQQVMERLSGMAVQQEQLTNRLGHVESARLTPGNSSTPVGSAERANIGTSQQ
jgi:hypothetical protein